MHYYWVPTLNPSLRGIGITAQDRNDATELLEYVSLLPYVAKEKDYHELEHPSDLDDDVVQRHTCNVDKRGIWFHPLLVNRTEFYRQLADKDQEEIDVLVRAGYHRPFEATFLKKWNQIRNNWHCRRLGEDHALASDPYDHLLQGLARRVIYDRPEELVLGLSLGARIGFFENLIDPGPGRRQSRIRQLTSLRYACAANDFTTTARVIECIPEYDDSWDAREFLVVWLRSIRAIFVKDLGKLQGLLTHVVKLRSKYQATIVQCLMAISERNGPRLDNGLNAILKLNSRQKTVFRAEHIVCLDAHAIHNLMRHVFPDLVSEFDSKRPIPWDHAMFEWQRSHAEFEPTLDFASISPLLDHWMTKLPCDATNDQLADEFRAEMKKR